MWRLWIEGKATLEELDRSWSLDDVLRGNDALDAWFKAINARQEAAAQGAKR